MFVRFEAETTDPVLRVLRANGLQNSDRDHVLGFFQGCPHAHWTLKSSIVILRFPRLAAGHP